jgi:response regulator RpfG family c-di-GMP phosphodiesterase
MEEVKEDKKTIAIIDDDNNFLFLVQSLLAKEGYRVLAYSDAISFQKAFLASVIDLDLIITDVDMPFKSGIELIYDLTLLKPKTISSIPVVFLTGRSDAITINSAFENNVLFIYYLLKPLNFTLLLMTVQKLLLLKEQHNTIEEANTDLKRALKQLKEDYKCSENSFISQQKQLCNEQAQLKMYLKDLLNLSQKQG